MHGPMNVKKKKIIFWVWGGGNFKMVYEVTLLMRLGTICITECSSKKEYVDVDNIRNKRYRFA